MKWKPIGANTYESDTVPVYRVMRCTANGVPTGNFVAFRGRSRTEVNDKGRTVLLEIPTVLGGDPTVDAAIKRCRDDLALQAQKAAA